MPNRIIKESINESKGLSSCSIFAQDFYKRLITYADDYGRFNADTQIMIARLYPRELSVVSEEDIDSAFVELSGIGKIAFYTSKARKEIYGCFPNWGDHQRLRESKKKCPEPDDMEVNDWYLRRFVPIDMKASIVERDNFKCQECGKFLASCMDAKKFVKLGSGLFHIDHIVPCDQGGRATMENLRLLCPTCNLKRKRRFTPCEIAEFTAEKITLPKVAASCGELPPESNPNPNPESKSISAGARNFTPPTVEEVREYCQERNNGVNPEKWHDFYTSKGWMVGKSKMKDWKASVRTWERDKKQESDNPFA